MQSKVYELCSSDEYAWDKSLGLYSTLEAAKRAFPDYVVIYDNPGAEDNHLCIMLAHPKYVRQVQDAWAGADGGYWWYALDGHGTFWEGDGPRQYMFLGIFPREVKE